MTADEALEIARLASLDQLDYQHERKAAAKALGCSVGALDGLVRAARACDLLLNRDEWGATWIAAHRAAAKAANAAASAAS